MRPMKWVVESSPAAVTRQSGKMATLRLSAAVTRRRGADGGEARRWRLVSQQIVLFLMTACSSINRR
ncbi:unnamed protein product [Spirodela intermedia]|uniref:Uncharacterized protein n=1 Tax=Spirodela intermedia TaxID=51605 RepID=A0ABN7E8W4_SPIIN|nr:unnamed protein product [Spirodela intermedia]